MISPKGRSGQASPLKVAQPCSLRTRARLGAGFQNSRGPDCGTNSTPGEAAELEPAKRHPHVLKHSLASHLVAGNVNPLVKQALGHRSINSTMQYVGTTYAASGRGSAGGLDGAFLAALIECTVQRNPARRDRAFPLFSLLPS